MPVQDLTPQLRTRLSRVERVVGLFVSVASLLLLAGFAYYIYHTGQRRGWWVDKYTYFTYTDSGGGLAEGGEVRLLGFPVGEITKVTAMEPFYYAGAVYVEFIVREPFQDYIWTDSRAKVVAAGFVGNRMIEVLPGGHSGGTNLHATYKKEPTGQKGVWDDQAGAYIPVGKFKETVKDAKTGETKEVVKEVKGYWLMADESPAVTERLEQIANQAQLALPAILDLTNRVNLVLSNVAGATAQAQKLLADAGPLLSNVTTITANIKDPKGSLGEWLIPTNLNTQLVQTLATANVTLTNANTFIAHTDTNVTGLATNLDATLINVANITSNLNAQVQANTNLVKNLSDIIVNANDMIQGLKKHWFLRSAFKKKDEPADEKEEKPKRESRRRESNDPIDRQSLKAGKWR
jgi:ABC-type transporter Mla subunit MlaD